MENKSYKQIFVGCEQSREYIKTGKCYYNNGGFRFIIEKGDDGKPHVTKVTADPTKWANTEFDVFVRGDRSHN